MKLLLKHWTMQRFRGKQKSPQEVIRTLKEALTQLNRYDNKDDKRRQKVRIVVRPSKIVLSLGMLNEVQIFKLCF